MLTCALLITSSHSRRYRVSGADAIAEGLVDEVKLDASVKRLLRPMFQMGLFDPVDDAENQPYESDSIDDSSMTHPLRFFG